jgi:hypothetical protein
MKQDKSQTGTALYEDSFRIFTVHIRRLMRYLILIILVSRLVSHIGNGQSLPAQLLVCLTSFIHAILPGRACLLSLVM